MKEKPHLYAAYNVTSRVILKKKRKIYHVDLIHSLRNGFDIIYTLERERRIKDIYIEECKTCAVTSNERELKVSGDKRKR